MSEASRWDWIKLDNAAKIFPAATSHRITHFFRIAVELDEPVDVARLQSALEKTLSRYPLFKSRLQRGVFWYTLEYSSEHPRIYPESKWPCMPFKRKYRSELLYRVRHFENRISLEVSHVLTDGMGACEFVKTLVTQYFVECGVEVDDWTPALSVHEAPRAEEWEDSFSSLYRPSAPATIDSDRAFRVPEPLIRIGRYVATTGYVNFGEIQAECKSRGATITEFLTATLLMAYQDYRRTLSPQTQRRWNKPIRVVVPVNLRKLFDSRSLRNFFLVVPIEIDPRLGEYTFDETLNVVRATFEKDITKKSFLRQISRNVSPERHPINRIVPIAIKDFVLSKYYKHYERLQTCSLSNLGRIDFPAAVRERVVRGWFLPPPSPITKVNCGIASVGSRLAITFGRLCRTSEIERLFFTSLRRLGLSVKIESNADPGGD